MPGENNVPQAPTFDPSKNVLDLVLAAVRRLDDLGASVVKRQDDLRDALDKRTSELSGLRGTHEDRLFTLRNEYEKRIETLRTSQDERLEAVKTDFGKQIANILSQQTEKNANLLATALAAVTERLAVVEKNQYVTGGQTAVRDPVVTQSLDQLGRNIEAINLSVANLTRTTNTTRDVDSGSKAGATHNSDQNIRMMMMLVGLGTLVVPVVLHFLK